MSSQRQIDANRRNAARSTGPRTPAGKATVARNRLSHGLRSRDPLVPGEDRSEYEDLLAGCLAHFQPADSFEEALVRQLASAEWRLRRVARVEAGFIAVELSDIRQEDDGLTPDRTEEEERYDEQTRLLGSVFARNAEIDTFSKLMRYENGLRRAFNKALDQLNSRPPRPAPADTPPDPEPALDHSKPISTPAAQPVSAPPAPAAFSSPAPPPADPIAGHPPHPNALLPLPRAA